MLLLTSHGTVVCLNAGDDTLTHRPVTTHTLHPLSLDGATMPSPLSGMRPRTAAHAALGSITVIPIGGSGLVAVARNNLYLSSDAEHPAVAFTATGSGGQESFLPIPEAELGILQYILRSTWILRHTRQVLRPGAIQLGEGFRLHLGAIAINLASQMPTRAEGPDTAPTRLKIAQGNNFIEMILAKPTASPFVALGAWPMRSRRAAGIMALAAHRHVTGLEPEQSQFDADVKFLRTHGGAAGLSDLLHALQDTSDSSGAHSQPTAESDATMLAWARREMAPWQLNPVSVAHARAIFDELNAREPDKIIFQFADNTVTTVPKPASATQGMDFTQRTEQYLGFFRAAAELLPAGLRTTICMTMHDRVSNKLPVPLFAFQKTRGEDRILVPDVDFLLQDFYESPLLVDPHPYARKQPTAVFAGSTTGGMISTQVARDLATPRLRAAGFFSFNPRVDFRLPLVVQCTTPEAQALLEAQPFCQKPSLPWGEQFNSRFVLSIDGNGATCSRVVIALMSNSLLLKYDSDDVLYYFGGLQPWLHYIPVSDNSDVEKIMDMEARDTARFQHIAAAGSLFARTYLTRAATLRYTAMLLQLYAASFAEA